MGYSCYLYSGAMLLVPDMRVPGEDVPEVGMKCPTHSELKSGPGEFCSTCGAKKIEYAKKTMKPRQCYDELEEFLNEFGGEDKFFDTYLNVTTEFLGRKYVRHEYLYIPQDEGQGTNTEIHPMMAEGFGVHEPFVADGHNTEAIRKLRDVLEKYKIPHEYKIANLIYRL